MKFEHIFENLSIIHNNHTNMWYLVINNKVVDIFPTRKECIDTMYGMLSQDELKF